MSAGGGARFYSWRVPSQVHGVLRNIKLEAPKPSHEGASRLIAAAAAGATSAAEGSLPGGEHPPQPSSSSTDETAAGDDFNEHSPASFSRLGARNDDGAKSVAGAGGGATTTKVVPSPSSRPKYTWFSLYDEQGVGGRRNSTLRTAGSSGAGSGGGDGFGAVDNSDDGKRSGSHKEPGSKENSSKAESSWRWGWGRKGSGNNSSTPKTAEATTPEGGNRASTETSAGTAEAASAAASAAAIATLSPVTAEETPASGSGDQTERGGSSSSQVLGADSEGGGEALQGLEVLSTLRVVSSDEGEEDGAAVAVAAGRRLAESVQRERKRLRRKDVYSYFVMPLVRALEAQMGTTAWLRKVGIGPAGLLCCLMSGALPPPF